jgi:3'(2'), 5'-bisphosphate nucleotidase
MSLTTEQREAWLVELLATGRAAAEAVIRVYAQPDLGIEYSPVGEPITRADKDASALIVARLQKAFPNTPIVNEDSDPSTFEGYARASVSFFVDPLCGTQGLIERNGEFSVLIGVAERGHATMGVIVCPSIGHGTYVGVQGVGAFVVREDGTRTPLRLSATNTLARARCGVSRFRGSRSIDAKVAALGCKEIVPFGSEGIAAAEVAAGALEVYAHPSRAFTRLWSACAPDAIVHAAGGLYTDAKGRSFDYAGPLMQGAGVVAASPTLHPEIIRCFVGLDQRTGGETLN